MYPLISVDLQKLKENAAFLLAACRRSGIHLSAVTKVVCAQEDIVRALSPYADSFADSRLENLRRIKVGKPKLLLRLGDPGQAADIVRDSDLSLQSEPGTLEALGQAARSLQKAHRVILMIDLGDLREGLLYSDRRAILQAAQIARAQPGLELLGLGVNLTCFGGILPDEDNLRTLADIAAWLRQELDLPLPLVSGGNSSSLSLMLRGGMPPGINHLRLGESLMLGRDTALGAPLPGLHQDVFTLSARLGEVQWKPSRPVGSSGPNAFGERPVFPDLGPMRRGIALVGRQDIDAEGLVPRDPRVRVLGASSDHLILDLTAAPAYQVGDSLDFGVSYGALLRAFTSPYVSKVIQGDTTGGTGP
ncbi:MAG: alanine racemase [Christensenellales bacterium]